MGWATRLEDCRDAADYAYCTCAIYSCGYSQPNRTHIGLTWLRSGQAETDCSAGVSWWLFMGGLLDYVPWFATSYEIDFLVEQGFELLDPDYVEPQRNDVLWRSGHTALYIGDGMQAEALRTEQFDAGYSGSIPGDQDGGETVVREYPAGGWTWILRPSKQQEAVVVTPKQEAGNRKNDAGLCYRAHCQDVGWLPAVFDGQQAGTVGYCKRLEAIKIAPLPGWVLYVRAHVQNVGWVSYEGIQLGDSSGEGSSAKDPIIGSIGKGQAIEALIIGVSQRPAGDNRKLYFQVHQQNTGWKGATPEGYCSGTDGMGIQLEAVRIWVE